MRSENLANISTECFTFIPMKTEAFSRNIGKVFRSQSWCQGELFFFLLGRYLLSIISYQKIG